MKQLILGTLSLIIVNTCFAAQDLTCDFGKGQLSIVKNQLTLTSGANITLKVPVRALSRLTEYGWSLDFSSDPRRGEITEILKVKYMDASELNFFKLETTDGLDVNGKVIATNVTFSDNGGWGFSCKR